MGGGNKRVRVWEKEKENERKRENIHSFVHYTCLHIIIHVSQKLKATRYL